MPTNGPNESELEGVLHVRRLFFTAQTDKADAVIDTLSTIPVADVQHDSVPFRVKEQAIQTSVSNLISNASKSLRTFS